MKAQEIPPPLRGFHKTFERLAYRWSYSDVFDDFLTIGMCCYAHGLDEERYFQVIKKYNRKELDLFARLMADWMICQSRQVEMDGWYDALGTFYEILAHRYKQKRLGQYFTPPDLCTVMAQILLTGEESHLRFRDPCSGSGRMLLAMHKISPQNYYSAADLDPLCCKMTCLNMLIHGMVGEVHHMDSLRQEVYTSWVVNHKLRVKKIPSIVRVPA